MENIKNSNILIIDDSKLNRTFIKNSLKEINVNTFECQDGQKGLNIIEEKKIAFDLVIVDTVMPIMDGLEFIKKTKSINRKNNSFTPIILMTGNDDVDAKIKGLNIGADDFLQKPINPKELIARCFSLLRLKKTHDLLYQKNLQTKKELQAAKKVQQFIIPEKFSFIKSINISGKYYPMEDIGGDFFDAYDLGDEKTGILIADVTGHGIPAALIVTMSKMIFNIYAPQFKSTAALLKKVNVEIKKLLLEDQYITAFYVIYDKKNKILRYTNAGHVKPLLYRNSKNKIKELDTNGFFIGILDNVDYEEKAVKIEDNDSLFLYTDGVTEIKNSNNEEFGEINLAKFILNNKNLEGDNFCSFLFDTLNEFANKRNDDIAYLKINF